MQNPSVSQMSSTKSTGAEAPENVWRLPKNVSLDIRGILWESVQLREKHFAGPESVLVDMNSTLYNCRKQRWKTAKAANKNISIALEGVQNLPKTSRNCRKKLAKKPGKLLTFKEFLEDHIKALKTLVIEGRENVTGNLKNALAFRRRKVLNQVHGLKKRWDSFSDLKKTNSSIWEEAEMLIDQVNRPRNEMKGIHTFSDTAISLNACIVSNDMYRDFVMNEKDKAER